MKKVFKNNAEVCHVWAQQNQTEGRAGNIFFRDASIFSYGHHFEMARFVKDDEGRSVVLMNSRSYSVSTSGHQSDVRNAISGSVPIYRVKSMTDHNENILEMFKNINEELKKFTCVRSMVDWHVEQIQGKIQNLMMYSEHFEKSISPENKRAVDAMYVNRKLYPTKVEIDKAKQREENNNRSQKEKIERAKRADEIRRAIYAKENAEKLEKWLAGENVSFGYRDGIPLRLRIKDDEVQTTLGAAVPLSFCKRFWQRYKADPETVKGLPMGHYKIDDVRDDNVIAGCHVIPRSEIERMAVVLNW